MCGRSVSFLKSRNLLELLSTNALCPVTSGCADQLERLRPDLAGECLENPEGLEGKLALVTAVLEAIDKAFPVTDLILAPVLGVSIGHHMEVAVAVIVMDVEDGQSLTQSHDVVIQITTQKVGVSDVQTEAEDVLACFFVQLVQIPASLVDIGAGTLDDTSLEGTEQIFQTQLDTVLLRAGHHRAIHVQIGLDLDVLCGASDGMNDYSGTAKIGAHTADLLNNSDQIFIDMVHILDKEREGGMHLEMVTSYLSRASLSGR